MISAFQAGEPGSSPGGRITKFFSVHLRFFFDRAEKTILPQKLEIYTIWNWFVLGFIRSISVQTNDMVVQPCHSSCHAQTQICNNYDYQKQQDQSDSYLNY
jgi:hypothetical protein